MPHFEIKLLEGKSELQKKKLTEALVKTAQEIIGYENESYSISIEDFSFDQWKNEIYPNFIDKKQDLLYKKPGYKL